MLLHSILPEKYDCFNLSVKCHVLRDNVERIFASALAMLTLDAMKRDETSFCVFPLVLNVISMQEKFAMRSV